MKVNELVEKVVQKIGVYGVVNDYVSHAQKTLSKANMKSSEYEARILGSIIESVILDGVLVSDQRDHMPFNVMADQIIYKYKDLDYIESVEPKVNVHVDYQSNIENIELMLIAKTSIGRDEVLLESVQFKPSSLNDTALYECAFEFEELGKRLLEPNTALQMIKAIRTRKDIHENQLAQKEVFNHLADLDSSWETMIKVFNEIEYDLVGGHAIRPQPIRQKANDVLDNVYLLIESNNHVNAPTDHNEMEFNAPHQCHVSFSSNGNDIKYQMQLSGNIKLNALENAEQVQQLFDDNQDFNFAQHMFSDFVLNGNVQLKIDEMHIYDNDKLVEVPAHQLKEIEAFAMGQSLDESIKPNARHNLAKQYFEQTVLKTFNNICYNTNKLGIPNQIGFNFSVQQAYATQFPEQVQHILQAEESHNRLSMK